MVAISLQDEALKEKLASLVESKLESAEDYERVRGLLRKKAQQDLWFFAYHVCNFPDIKNSLHVEMCERWDARRKRRFSLWLIPRSHLKTTLWTVAGTLWEFVQDIVELPGKKAMKGRDLRVLIVNAKLDNAIDILRDIKAIVTQNTLFKWLFPEYVPDDTYGRGKGAGKWQTDRIDFPCSRQVGRKEGSIEVMSVGASLVSKHYDVMIFDDPVNDENTTTKQYRDKIHKWYRDSLQLRNDPITSRVRIIGTRWHFDDLYARLIKQEEQRRQAQKEAGKPAKPVYLIYRRKAIESGRPIWHERFTLDELNRLKFEELGSYVYSCQYDNDPLPEEDAYFKRNQIQLINELDLPEELVYFASVDMADEETTRGDFSVISVAGFDEHGKMYVVEIQRGRFSTQEILTRIHFVCKRYNAAYVGIETTGFQKAIVRNYKHEAMHNGWHIPWKELNRGKTSKFKRTLSMQPLVERGDFYLLEDINNAEWLIEEMTTFPYGANDDILDTLVDIQNIYFAAPQLVKEVAPAPGSFDAIFGPLDAYTVTNSEDPLGLEYLCG